MSASFPRQRGAVLVVSLLVLLIMTLIGVSGATSIIMQEKMTFASRDAQLALQVAESAVRTAEEEIESLVDISSFNSSGNGGLYVEGEAPTDLFNEVTWDSAKTQEITVSMEGKTFPARYFIELAGEIDPEVMAGSVEIHGSNNVVATSGSVKVFRIVARGQGLANTRRMLVTYYGKLL
ncbi:pilus assembly PilX family protein [Microbulbifer guangxiensis]|uniref:pilus assembly PilX family protein n=1 Tax=Microbulbifer guangxiensis TaxID=2904249 RepID=UPI001F1C186C|nr:PilX N-terminal domain-containing pilus assembly protein [Microbulbifer guangxiensis]